MIWWHLKKGLTILVVNVDLFYKLVYNLIVIKVDLFTYLHYNINRYFKQYKGVLFMKKTVVELFTVLADLDVA